MNLLTMCQSLDTSHTFEISEGGTCVKWGTLFLVMMARDRPYHPCIHEARAAYLSYHLHAKSIHTELASIGHSSLSTVMVVEL